MDHNGIYSEDFTLLYRDVDMHGRWRVDSILYLMQEVSGTHAALLGSDRSSLLQRGAVWVLSRTHLVMDRYPTALDTVTVTTWPSGGNRFMFYRHYTFRDGGGRELGRATTVWILLDTVERRALPASVLPVPLPENADVPPPLPVPRKLKELTGPLSGSLAITPRYGDHDVNGHVNNTRYGTWFCDIPSPQYHGDHTLREIQINYSQEILPGQTLTLEYLWEGDGLRCQGRGQCGIYFHAQGTFVPVQSGDPVV